jgi:hypothetical protein
MFGGRDKSSSAYDDSRVNWQGISNSATGEIAILESDDYSGVTQFGSPLSGINNIGTYTGSRFAFYADFQDLQVDTNYVSGSLINSYAVYTNTLLSNMGIYQTNMSGTWTYNGVSETVNVLVGTAPPVPDTGSTAALLGVGVFVLAAARRRLG